MPARAASALDRGLLVAHGRRERCVPPHTRVRLHRRAAHSTIGIVLRIVEGGRPLWRHGGRADAPATDVSSLRVSLTGPALSPSPVRSQPPNSAASRPPSSDWYERLRVTHWDTRNQCIAPCHKACPKTG